MSIKATFPAGVTEITVNGLHQWDYGQKLEIHVEDLPAMVEVHFACAGMQDAVVRSCANTNGVIEAVIPDHCLEQTTPIVAWVYFIEETAGTTVLTVKMPIVPRTKPQASASVPTYFSDKYTEAIEEINKHIEILKDGTVTVSDAEHATNADYATEAGYAIESNHAQSAEHAQSATVAQTAGKATEADHATKADNADWAAKATEATLAAVAESADHADTAGTAVTAQKDESGRLLTTLKSDGLSKLSRTGFTRQAITAPVWAGSGYSYATIFLGTLAKGQELDNICSVALTIGANVDQWGQAGTAYPLHAGPAYSNLHCTLMDIGESATSSGPNGGGIKDCITTFVKLDGYISAHEDGSVYLTVQDLYRRIYTSVAPDASFGGALSGAFDYCKDEWGSLMDGQWYLMDHRIMFA